MQTLYSLSLIGSFKRDYSLDHVYLRCFVLFFLLLWATCYTSKAQFGSDLGKKAISNLAWDHISSTAAARASIGLTTNKNVYVWGDNRFYTINTNFAIIGANAVEKSQLTPFFVPFPSGEAPKKVRVTSSDYYLSTGAPLSMNAPTFACLTESGKLYGWGLQMGLMGTAWTQVTTTPAAGDTVKAKRTPVQLTILGESSFVDFDMPQVGDFWFAIGASGKAYHIGRTNGSGATFNATFKQIPFPTGVNASTFKYVAVWCAKTLTSTYLKGNDGKIYFTGSRAQSMATGVPALHFTLSGASGVTFPGGTPPTTEPIDTAIPLLVPFPVGEDIVKIDFATGAGYYYNSLALSASGKAYGAGLWRAISANKGYNYSTFAVKNAPTPNTELGTFFYSVTNDTLYVLKQFVELALPPGASKIIDVAVWGLTASTAEYHASLVVGDNNKTYWSGRTSLSFDQGTDLPNFLQYAGMPSGTNTGPSVCNSIDRFWVNSPYAWTVEAINFEGASKIYRMFNESSYASLQPDQAFIISKSGKGYFQGDTYANAGLGKISSGPANNLGGETTFKFKFPTPIANEQLDNCNTSPGVVAAGPADPTPGVGAIDCSKTKLSPAPVAGVPSQLTLSVTVNVTTAGSFSPLSVSGSGMSLGNGITSVTTTTTGVQTFSIPVNYNGSTLTNAFQFTIGQAGSCTADLTTKPNREITNVWSLTNCSAITPGVLSK